MNNLKKILIFGMGDNLGGVESVIYNYYTHFNKRKIHADFLTNCEKMVHEDEIIAAGSKVYKITQRSKNYFQYRKDLKDFFDKHGHEYDTIWVNICLLSNIDYLKYAKKYGIKKRIIHCHNSKNMGSFINGICHNFNKLFISRYATDFWTCSHEASKFFFSKKIMNSSKYLLINNAIDYDKYKYNKSVRNKIRNKMNWDNKVVIGNVGRLHFQKNQEFAIKVFKELNKKIPNSVFVIVGDGPDGDKLKQLVNELKLGDKVEFLGMRNDIPELLQAMDIFLFPSLFEGLSIALIEAQASGILIATSNNVSAETKMSDNIHFWSLDMTASEWAKLILKEYKSYNREKAINDIINKGFDIKQEAKKIEDII